MVALRLAYAGHACRTQGAEAPVVLVVPGDHHTSLESGYSSLSRGQEEIHVFADTTTHGADPIAHLAERWQQPGPKRRATARAREWASQITTEPPAAVVPPVGGGPMTGRQAAYLATLAAQAGEEATEALTRLEATGRITDASGAHRAQDPGVGAQDRVGDRGDRRRSPASHGGPTSSGGSPARRGALEAAEPRPALP